MIRRGEGESLRSYVKRFNREVLEVEEMEDKVQLTTFKAGLKLKEFMVALVKSPSRSMAKMPLKAQKYMNVKDTLAVIGHEGPQRRNTQDEQKS